MDDDDSGTINFMEFVRLLASARTGVNISALNQISELREAFAMYDTDGSGSLDVEEIQEALRLIGNEKSQEEVRAMMDKVRQAEARSLPFLRDC